MRKAAGAASREAAAEPGTRVAHRERMKLRRLVFAAAALLALVTGYAVWDWASHEERRALAALEPQVRHELYERTLENLRAVCGPPKSSGLESFCAREARFALQFEQCDEQCRVLANAQRSLPSR
jgi:hypothetical protein